MNTMPLKKSILPHVNSNRTDPPVYPHNLISVYCKFGHFREGFMFREKKSSRNGEITLSFTDHADEVNHLQVADF